MARNVDVVIIGAGTAGLNAAAQVRRHTQDYLLVDGGPLGTTCARVGCMPSKVLIQVAEDFHRRLTFAEEGIAGAELLELDRRQVMRHVRTLRDGFAGKVTHRLETNLSAKLIRGYARFTGPDRVEVNGETIVAKRFVIAVGSRPVVPAPWRALGDAMLTSDEIFELEELPESLGVIGLGAIGVEIGQAMARLGVRVVGVDQLTTIAGLSDPKVAARAIEIIGEELPLWLGEPATLERTAEGRVRVRTDSRDTTVDKVLVAVGRRHNLDRLGLESLGVPLDERGVPRFDTHTQQVADLPIFIAGDASADRGVLHEATHQGRVAGSNAGAGAVSSFARKPTMWLAFTDPGIGQVGALWSQLEGRDDVVVGEVDFANQGRAKVMRRHRGLMRVYGDKRTGKVLGASMLAPGAEHLAHLLSWALVAEPTVFELHAMPFYHPVLEEGLENALTDLAAKVTASPPAPLGLSLGYAQADRR